MVNTMKIYITFTLIYPLPEIIKTEEAENLVANLHDKEDYVLHTRNLKQALNHRLVMKEVHRVIKCYQKVWLKPYIDINTDLKQKAKTNFEKKFFKLMYNVVLGKTMKKV